MFEWVVEIILYMWSAWSIIDDILVTEKMTKERLENLEAALTWLEEAGLQLKWDRCAFLLSTVKYLGYKMMAQGLQPTVDEVKAVQMLPHHKMCHSWSQLLA